MFGNKFFCAGKYGDISTAFATVALAGLFSITCNQWSGGERSTCLGPSLFKGIREVFRG